MNKLTIIGNLTADPELRTIPSGINVCTFTVAVNRRFADQSGEKKVDYFRVAAWRQLGENCSKYLAKGKKVCVVGEVTARAFEAKDGSLRASLEVTADEVEFLSPKEQNPGYGSGWSGERGTNYPAEAFTGSAPSRYGNTVSQKQERMDYYGSPANPGTSMDGFTEITDSDLPF